METATKSVVRQMNDPEMYLIKGTELSHEPAQKVESYAQIRNEVKAMLPFVDKDHEGQHSEAYAISHCQVAEKPFAFFVVNTKLFKTPDTRLKFPSRVIINAEIIEKKEFLMADVGEPKELLTIDLGEGAECEVCHERICYCNWRQHSSDPKVRVEEPVKRVIQPRVRVGNVKRYPEACMSFQHRNPKKVDRYAIIKVRYQIPKMLGNGFKTIEEEIDGLKAHIFQHEIDHANRKNIFYND